MRSRSLRWLWDEDEEDMPDDYDPENEQTFVDYNFVADYGWDPLELSRFDLHLGSGLDKVRPLQVVIRDYREAELRHGRLAMLAALAWPVQELLSPTLSRALRQPILVAETGGRTPSVLNGGLEQSTIPLTIGAFFVLNLLTNSLASLGATSPPVAAPTRPVPRPLQQVQGFARDLRQKVQMLR